MYWNVKTQLKQSASFRCWTPASELFQLLDTLVDFGHMVSVVLYLSLAAYVFVQSVLRFDSWSIAFSCITRHLSINVLVNILLVATVIFRVSIKCFQSFQIMVMYSVMLFGSDNLRFGVLFDGNGYSDA